MAMTEEVLLRKKKEIETKKESLNELKGEIKGLLKRLNDEFGCKDLAEAKEKLEKLRKKVETLDEQIQEKTETLEQTYFKKQ